MAEDLSSVQLPNAEIKYALEHNPEFFIQFFMGDKLIFDVPEFHIEIFNLMISMDYTEFACAIPRGHAKTTLAKLACIWFYLFTDFRFIVYVSNTVGIAIPSTNDITGFLRDPNFESVYGKVKFEVAQEGKGAYKFWIGDKLCFMRAFGVGQQVRGINIDHQRPEMAILDDVDAATGDVTEKSFDDMKRWFYGPFYKAVTNPGTPAKFIQLGNLTENMSLIAEHCQDEFWASRVYGCLKSDGTPLWNDFWPIEALKLDYQKYCSRGMAAVWFAEMMNMPSAGGRGVILAEEITYAPPRQEDDLKYGFITIDLAISDKEWAHETVIACHGWIEEGGINGQWQAVETKTFLGIDPINLFWEVIRLCKKWRIQVVGIESVAYQASVKYVFQHECLRNGIQFNEDCIPGKTGISFVQLQAIGRKPQRIIAWAAMIKAGEYALNQNDFTVTQQLIAYRPDKKTNQDDIIDALSYATQMLDRWMYLIMQEYVVGSLNTYEGSATICDF